MAIVVHDTLALFEPLFTSDLAPKALFERASDTLFYGHNCLANQLAPVMKHKGMGGYAVMEAAQLDGFAALNQQQAWGLFNPSRKRYISAYQFEQLRALDVLNWLETKVQRCAQYFGLEHDIQVFLLPTDSANRNVMIDALGVSGFGGVPGYLIVRIWPTAGNLQRLDVLLARLMTHQLISLQAAIGEFDLGQWLRMEGLASLAIEALSGSALPWAAYWQKSADYDDALAKVAELRGIDKYDHLLTNIYGGIVPIGTERPPTPRPMDNEMLAYAEALFSEALNETEPVRIAAYMYGDEIVARQGYPTIGLPPYAGFEIAEKWAKTANLSPASDFSECYD